MLSYIFGSSNEQIGPLREEVERLRDEVRNKDELLEVQAQRLENLTQVVDKARQDISCCICFKIVVDLYVLNPCGHTACMKCLKEYFKTTRPEAGTQLPAWRKICHLCQTPVVSRPIQVYMLKDVAGHLGEGLSRQNSVVNGHEAADPAENVDIPAADPWVDIFPAQGYPVGLWDPENWIRRCRNCRYAIQDGVCTNPVCGELYEIIEGDPDPERDLDLESDNDRSSTECGDSDDDYQDSNVDEPLPDDRRGRDESEWQFVARLQRERRRQQHHRRRQRTQDRTHSSHDSLGEATSAVDPPASEADDTDYADDGNLSLPVWEPPAYRLASHAKPLSANYQKLMRRGVPSAMLGRFKLLYSHKYGIKLHLNNLVYRLGFNLHLKQSDFDGRKFVERLVNDCAIRARRCTWVHGVNGSEGVRLIRGPVNVLVDDDSDDYPWSDDEIPRRWIDVPLSPSDEEAEPGSSGSGGPGPFPPPDHGPYGPSDDDGDYHPPPPRRQRPLPHIVPRLRSDAARAVAAEREQERAHAQLNGQILAAERALRANLRQRARAQEQEQAQAQPQRQPQVEAQVQRPPAPPAAPARPAENESGERRGASSIPVQVDPPVAVEPRVAPLQEERPAAAQTSDKRNWRAQQAPPWLETFPTHAERHRIGLDFPTSVVDPNPAQMEEVRRQMHERAYLGAAQDIIRDRLGRRAPSPPDHPLLERTYSFRPGRGMMGNNGGLPNERPPPSSYHAAAPPPPSSLHRPLQYPAQPAPAPAPLYPQIPPPPPYLRYPDAAASAPAEVPRMLGAYPALPAPAPAPAMPNPPPPPAPTAYRPARTQEQMFAPEPQARRAERDQLQREIWRAQDEAAEAEWQQFQLDFPESPGLAPYEEFESTEVERYVAAHGEFDATEGDRHVANYEEFDPTRWDRDVEMGDDHVPPPLPPQAFPPPQPQARRKRRRDADEEEEEQNVQEMGESSNRPRQRRRLDVVGNADAAPEGDVVREEVARARLDHNERGRQARQRRGRGKRTGR